MEGNRASRAWGSERATVPAAEEKKVEIRAKTSENFGLLLFSAGSLSQ